MDTAKVYILQFATGEITSKFDTRLNWTGTSAYSSESKAKRTADKLAYARAGVRWETDPTNRIPGIFGDYQDDLTGAEGVCRILELEVDLYYLPIGLSDLDKDIF
jgi:hypothetical protein